MKYVEDTFIGADGTDLSAHAPDIDRPGGGYAEIAGDWEIASNAAGVTSVANARVVILTDLADGRFKVDASIVAATKGAFLVFRSNAGCTNYWLAGLDDTAQQVQLLVASGGAPAVQAFRAYAVDEAETYEIKVVCRADEITVYIDDAVQIRHTSATHETEEHAGLYSDTNVDVAFDDLVADERPTCHYCTTADVKSRLGAQFTSGTTYDEELEADIEEASRLIDLEKGWEECHYSASDLAMVTRYYDGLGGTEQEIDRFLDDAAFAVAVDDDGDGVYTAWVRNTDYITWPYNVEYITELFLATGSTVSFTVAQRSVQVTGRLGAYSEPPAVVRKAAVIMVAKAYKRGMQMFQDTGAIVELGQLKYVLAIDPEVEKILSVLPRRVNYG
ncbi:MAG TPA: hypothetical protein VMW79_10905 [Anaerolineae bacterium]|nr:hypothetical protein [Anaerolineae bacterium]